MGNIALLMAVVKKLGSKSIGITKAVIIPYSVVKYIANQSIFRGEL